MKVRSVDTMSERQLMLAMAENGRKVSLSDLTAWRQDGLLPPLASSGVHNGRTYYWREPDILEQAQTAFDELRRHGRVDAAMIALWLGGFEVPLPRLRRAWLHGHKLNKPFAIRRAAAVTALSASDLSGFLHQAVASAITAMHPQDSDLAGLAMLEHAAARLGLKRSATSELRQAWHMAQVTLSLLSASDLVRQASDDMLRRAQRALRTGLDFVWQSGGAENRGAAAAVLGRPLFLYILVLLASGREAQVEAMLARIAHRRHRTPALEPAYVGA